MEFLSLNQAYFIIYMRNKLSCYPITFDAFLYLCSTDKLWKTAILGTSEMVFFGVASVR
jgi:hypothetical protein